jgi:hypothetical protein
VSLLDDIESEKAGEGTIPCPTCRAVQNTADLREREALREVVASTLSMRAVLRLSKKHDLGIGAKSLRRHREEGHQP